MKIHHFIGLLLLSFDVPAAVNDPYFSGQGPDVINHPDRDSRPRVLIISEEAESDMKACMPAYENCTDDIYEPVCIAPVR